ncbi:ATP synthase subunit I [Alkalithermobacter paradoxus]|uniref:ATP synthase I chain n=1 Tax=Alkalithermobacter paradoxus TaxID=29349 RepID=A0A1V4I5M0_9FIRM|nr:ATP synthase I chain [[Clostridium] thermoalcaliphilum]
MKKTGDIPIQIIKMVIILNGVAIMGFLTFNRFALDILYGLAFGSIFSLLNFRLLHITLRKAVLMSPEKAQIYVFTRYLIRMVLTGVVLFISIKGEYINLLAAIIGLLMPKISILIINLFGINKISKGKEA